MPSAGTGTQADPVWIMQRLRSIDRDRDGTVSGHIQHEADAAHIGDHVGTAVRKEGKGNACDRH